MLSLLTPDLARARDADAERAGRRALRTQRATAPRRALRLATTRARRARRPRPAHAA